MREYPASKWAHMPGVELNVLEWNVLWSDTARGLHCYTAQQPCQRRITIVYTECLRLSQITHVWPPASVQWGLDVEYVMECGWLTDARCTQSLPWQWSEWTPWTKNWLCMCLGSPTLSPTSAEMATANLDSMCIAHSWQGERSYCKYKVSDCSDVVRHYSDVHLLY